MIMDKSQYYVHVKDLSITYILCSSSCVVHVIVLIRVFPLASPKMYLTITKRKLFIIDAASMKTEKALSFKLATLLKLKTLTYMLVQ